VKLNIEQTLTPTYPPRLSCLVHAQILRYRFQISVQRREDNKEMVDGELRNARHGGRVRGSLNAVADQAQGSNNTSDVWPQD
jgi:hypothetical protein